MIPDGFFEKQFDENLLKYLSQSDDEDQQIMEDLIHKSMMVHFNDGDIGNSDASIKSMNLGSIVVNPMGSHQAE